MILSEIIEFFKREKVYTALFAGFLLAFTYSHFFVPGPDTGRQKSSAVEKFQDAEKQLQRQLKEAGSLDAFLKDEPAIAGQFQLMSFVATGIFVVGLILNMILIFNPRVRRKLTRSSGAGAFSDWKVSMIFKVIVLFVSSSFLLSLALGLTKKYLAPGISINWLLLVQTTLVDIICLMLILHVIGRDGGRARDIGFQVPEIGWIREIGLGIAGYFSVYPVFIFVLTSLVILAHLLSYEPPPHPLVTVFLEEEEKSPALIIYSILIASVVGPLFEEMFFRGFCFTVLKKRFGRIAGLVLSSAFFAMIHQSTFAFWPIFVLGMVLGYLYDKRKSLIAPVTLHVIHNSVFIGYFFVAKQVVKQGAGM